MYSLRDLANRTGGIATSTVAALVHGRRQSDETTIAAVAEALRLEVTTIRAWAAQALGERQPFELPPEANRLTRRERDAVLAVVRAMLDPVGQVAESTTGSGKTEAAAGRLFDLARPPAPDLSKVAARRGTSEGRRRRAEQDKDAEPQDPSHPSHP